jgi:ATP-binding cassette, subfamily B, bacterial PglK
MIGKMNYSFIYITKVLYLLGDSKRKIPLLMLLFFISSILDLLGIGLIAPYISIVINSSNLDNSMAYLFVDIIDLSRDPKEIIIVFSIALVLLFLIKSTVSIMINKFIISYCFEHGVKMRVSLMDRYQTMPYLEYVERNSSEYIYRIQQLVNDFSQTLLHSILKLVSEGLVMIMVVLLLAFTSGISIALLITLIVIMLLFYNRYFGSKLNGYGVETNHYSATMVKAIREGVESFKEVKILAVELHFLNKVRSSAKKYASAAAKYVFITSIPRYLIELILVFFVVLLVLLFTQLGYESEALIPILSMFGVAAMRLAPSTNQIINGVTQIRYSRNTIDLLYSDMLKTDSDDNYQQVKRQNTKFKTLKVERATFTYPGMKVPALLDISLEINAGEVIGFIGASGSGKTSLVDLLLGILEPQKGKIFYNNSNFKEHLYDWMSEIAYLPQKVFLTDDSLKHNIALGIDESDINENDIKKATLQAKLNDLIEDLPEGVDTFLGEGGIRISGGQRQKVALARAFYHNRQVLVMDESTSALDKDTEREIINEIKQLKGKVTMIIIAHRMTTLQHCDRIYKLDKGRIVKSLSYGGA